MAYNKEKIYEQALKAIDKHNLFFIEDVIAYLPCVNSTFYEFFPIGSDESNTIKEMVEANKISTKVKMRKNWLDSENATLQMGLMKIIATEDEAHRLNGSRTQTDITTKGEAVASIDYSKLSTEALKEITDLHEETES